MTNAQAALLAAATMSERRGAGRDFVTDYAAEFKEWLDSQDAKDREAANDYPSPVPDFGMTTREAAAQERPVKPCPRALAYNIFPSHLHHVNGDTLCPGALDQRRREEALRERSVSGWLTDEELAAQPSRPLSAAIADQAGVDYAG